MATRKLGPPKKKKTASTLTPGFVGPPIVKGGESITRPPGYLGPPIKKDGPKKAQQKLARRVKTAALESGMNWSDWSEQRKTLVGALRVSGTTKKSKKAVKTATSLIRKSEGAAAAKAYAKKATAQDAKGTKKKIRKIDGRPAPKSSGGKRYMGPPQRKKK